MRAFGSPATQAFQISKRVHRHDPADGAEWIRTELGPSVGLDVTGARGRALLQAVAAFEGMPRMRATHPGGFVLSSGLLGEYLPIEPTAMGRTVVQFDKDDLDRIGVPKFDFLGLGALSLVRRGFDIIEQRAGHRPSMYRLPTDDPATYHMIAQGAPRSRRSCIRGRSGCTTSSCRSRSSGPDRFRRDSSTRTPGGAAGRSR